MLVVGCGDVGTRAARRLLPRVRVLALVRSAADAARLRALGVTPLAGDLDAPASLQRLAGLAPRVTGLQKPLPAAAMQLCPEPGPAPGGDVDDVAVALMDLYGLYGQCAGLHVDLVRALEGKKP